MVESGLKETKENRVEITDFSFEDVKIIVQHIYEQEVKSLINDANAKSLLRLADKYNLNGIQVSCFLIDHSSLIFCTIFRSLLKIS